MYVFSSLASPQSTVQTVVLKDNFPPNDDETKKKLDEWFGTIAAPTRVQRASEISSAQIVF